MDRQQQQQASKTNAQQVRKQNQQSAQGNSYATEFASETNAQEVRQQNAQSAARKQQNSSNQQ
ncbi:gamma-type small acid-soluble spore protein [Halalkalibacter okhensis]|uniref:Small, acid-soluble spore protein gamma-type n=1 Tax=Halalkalibacter okhensis TaxID=333138 RepID=A0A0B0IK85_9BACI|nr:gamma-type small acid-soluble spore protein [Halalkalibacter okhensis]KHF41282.1 spore protein [Halalkalibacter okhensis]